MTSPAAYIPISRGFFCALHKFQGVTWEPGSDWAEQILRASIDSEAIKMPSSTRAIELRAADRWHKELGRVGESVFAVLRDAHFKTHRRCRGKVSVV